VRDPVWGSIFLTPALERLAASEPFAKLAGIKQLGPAHLVYPGATHTRYAHSLGVLHTARRLAAALDARGSLGFVSRGGLASFLVAALCHDLGHFPFAHSLKELPLAGHEALAARLLLAEPLRSLAGAAGADPEAAAAIVDDGLPDGGSREIAFFRGLLSGVLDPDKLDYLKKLNELYNSWIDNYKEGPLLIIDADTNKFAEKEEDLGHIITKIDSTLFGLF